MSSVNDIWAEMNGDATTVPKPIAAVPKKGKKKDKSGTGEKKEKGKESQKSALVVKQVPELDYASMTAAIARDVAASSEAEAGVRKKALVGLHATLFLHNFMADEGYSEVFRDICKPLFKRFADPIEKCRELAAVMTRCFFERCCDIVPVLGYYFPALIARLPSGYAYDEEMKVFVADMDAHDAFRRGRAVVRQDRTGSVSVAAHTVVEPSEEIRLLSCQTLATLIHRMQEVGACPVLHPYFQEIVVYLQAQLRDPFPDLKSAACGALEALARTDDYAPGMKFFAVGLVRAVLPCLRHRQAKVRCAAVAACHACMVVHDPAKRKASGSEAITDLVGFREENVLPVASFYGADVQVNHLAELVGDKSVAVREELAKFLYVLLTEIGDRYDHNTRLLPYVLDLLTDEMPSVANVALACLQRCGREYEDEHQDEIRDKRQYGVDGAATLNLDKPLPRPFLERPRVGMRLFVRGNSKRFLTALVNELTSWQSCTRLKSALLLKMLVVLCEEHLTVDAHTLFPSFIKAAKFAKDDKDLELAAALSDVFELLGRYIQPDVYVYYVLPRLRGDADVVQFGVDATTRAVAMEFLQALLSGSKPSCVVPHLDELVTVLTDPFVVPHDSPLVQAASLELLLSVFEAIRGRGNAVVASHFVATGRLSSLHKTVRLAFRHLLVALSIPALRVRAVRALGALAALDSDTGAQREELGVHRLYSQHCSALFEALAQEYEVDGMWTPGSLEHMLLCRLVRSPQASLQSNPDSLRTLLVFLCDTVESNADISAEIENSLMANMAELMLAALLPVLDEGGSGSSGSGSGSGSGRGESDGFVLVSTADAMGQCAAVISAQMGAILSAFVSDGRWGRSLLLQQKRLSVLALLTRAPLRVATTVEALWPQKRPSETPVEAFELSICDAVLAGAPLLRRAEAVLGCVLGAAFSQSLPAALRLDALSVAEHVLLQLRAYAGREKLKSHAYWAREGAGGGGGETPLRVLACKAAVQRCVAFLLSCLDDSDDAVRLACLSALRAAAALLPSEHDIIPGDMVSEEGEGEEAVRVLGQSPLVRGAYSACIVALLKQAVASGVGDGFLPSADDTLRTVAVLDPEIFESIVRAQVAPLLGRADKDGAEGEGADGGEGEGEGADVDGLGIVGMSADRLNDFVSGLLNHVDILKRFC